MLLRQKLLKCSYTLNEWMTRRKFTFAETVARPAFAKIRAMASVHPSHGITSPSFHSAASILACSQAAVRAEASIITRLKPLEAEFSFQSLLNLNPIKRSPNEAANPSDFVGRRAQTFRSFRECA
jgi:hypothetical protein